MTFTFAALAEYDDPIKTYQTHYTEALLALVERKRVQREGKKEK